MFEKFKDMLKAKKEGRNIALFWNGRCHLLLTPSGKFHCVSWNEMDARQAVATLAYWMHKGVAEFVG